MGTQADHRTTDDDRVAQNLAGDGAGRDPHRGLARRGPPAAAIVADAVFQVIGEVGMARPVALGDVAVVLGPLVDIVDQQRNGRAGRQSLEDAGQDAHLIGLLALGGEARLPRPAAVQKRLDVGLAERDARRAAVHHTADGRTVALAPGRDTEQVAKGVVGHRPPRSADDGGDVRRRRVLHADDVVAAIDMVDLARHPGCQMRQQIETGAAHLLGRHIASERRVQLIPLENVAEVADAAGRQRLDRAGADGVDADVPLAEVGR